MKAFGVSHEEAAGIAGFPAKGLYLLIRIEGKIINGELVDERTKLPVAATAMRQRSPDSGELLVVHFDGSMFEPASTQDQSLPFVLRSDGTNAMILGRP